MAEFEEKLGAILNDPQAMGQIMALAQALNKNSAPSEGPSAPPPPRLRQSQRRRCLSP